VQGGAEEGEKTCPVSKSTERYQGGFGYAVLKEQKTAKASDAEEEREEGLKVSPGVNGCCLHDGYENGNEGGAENSKARVVNVSEG
jgi:hypothetical protein